MNPKAAIQIRYIIKVLPLEKKFEILTFVVNKIAGIMGKTEKISKAMP
ncbi:hypothetical protein LAYK3_08070 [Lactobacillus amylovorus subsp. amylovorus]|nr:hypothetical protein LAYK3_08070 [Lactobacillus amylovorus]GMM21179.1 hypothetical protein LAYK10_04810 [Lactobacillus amylovorus]